LPVNSNSLKRITLTIVGKFIPIGIPIPILRGPLQGFKLITGAASGKVKGVSYILNLSESRRLNLTKQLIPVDGICFDVGANIGVYTLLFSKFSKFVYSFEPSPRNLSFLYKMLEINKIKNAQVVRSAVSDFVGFCSFKESNSCATGKLDDEGDLKVRVTSLDKFIEKSKILPDVIKIDVEGAELSVLKGAKNCISKNHPLIVLETHGDEIKKKCFEFLKNMNYKEIIPLDSESIKKANDFIIIS